MKAHLSIINRSLEKLAKVFMVRKILITLLPPSSYGLKGVREGERERAGIIITLDLKKVTDFSMEDEDMEECIKEQDSVGHDTVGVEQYRLHNDSIIIGATRNIPIISPLEAH